MLDHALTQDFTGNKLAFLQTHMLYISGGAPSDEDIARRIAISGYTPRRELPAIQLRPGEPTPNVTNHPANVWADELLAIEVLARPRQARGTGAALGGESLEDLGCAALEGQREQGKIEEP